MTSEKSLRSAEILPSVLAADFAHLGDQLQIIKDAGVKKIHFDIMDGMFVPSIALGFPVLESTRKATDLYLDVHLMVQGPERYIEETARCGADSIGVHTEACIHLHRTIYQIRDLGKDACVVLNPATDLSALNYILKDVNTVLLMTVNPGFGGQKYIHEMTRKIRRLKEMIDQKNPDCHIMCDGGICLDTITEAASAGADQLVVGSAVFNGDICSNILTLQQKLTQTCK